VTIMTHRWDYGMQRYFFGICQTTLTLPSHGCIKTKSGTLLFFEKIKISDTCPAPLLLLAQDRVKFYKKIYSVDY